MDLSFCFENSATAQIVIDPISNELLASNAEFGRLVARQDNSNYSVSKLFAASFPELILFTDEVLSTGRAWTDVLVISNYRLGELRVEATGQASDYQGRTLIHITLQSHNQLTSARDISNANQHFQSGIGHWNQVSRVFQEFERENQLLLDAAGEGIYGVDTNGSTTFVNPAAEKILGYSAAELAGRNMHSLVHHTDACGNHFNVDDCPIFAAFKLGIVQSVDDDIFWDKNGRPIDVEYTSTPITVDDVIVGAVVVFRDVTEKKAAQRRLLSAMEEVQHLKDKLELENKYLQEEINETYNHTEIIGNSDAVRQLINQIQVVAPTEATVLIHGESGTGKELIARAIHDASNRSDHSLIRVNCAAIPEALFESEFFGHVKGAFTGAVSDRAGRFELADGGSLFLDEVGEIPLQLQGKLLRVLQEQHFERVGEGTTRKVNVRIIAATNRDLKEMVAAGQFREDLYFRLQVFPLHSIPLRARKEDIPQLTKHFLNKAALRCNKPNLNVSMAELEKLKAYDWPGNIRELENIVERQVILAKDGFVSFPVLAPQQPNSQALEAGPAFASGDQNVITESEVKRAERDNIIKALRTSKGRISGASGAAQLLGIKPTTLTSRLKKMGISPNLFQVNSNASPNS